MKEIFLNKVNTQIENIKKSITPEVQLMACINYGNYKQIIELKDRKLLFLYGEKEIFENTPKNIKQAYKYYLNNYILAKKQSPYIWGKIFALCNLDKTCNLKTDLLKGGVI